MPNQTQRAFARELAKHDEAFAQAFLEAVQNITSAAQIAAIDAAISRNDVQGVITAMNLGAAFWAPLDLQIGAAFTAGAVWQQNLITGRRGAAAQQLLIGFDHRNPRAEQWMRQRGASLITELTNDTRLGAQRIVTEGIEQGWGTQRTRRALIGTRVGNQLRGGIIGLHSSQVDAVIKARAELSDPTRLREYLRRVGGSAPQRSTVNAAIRAERALTQPEIDRVVTSYSNRLLQARGQRIARTEAHNAFSAGTFEGVQQMIESGNLPASAVEMVWQATVGSNRTRDSHRAMNGQRVPFGQPFTSPVTGAQLMHPGDASLGAGGDDTINCRCGVRPVVDFAALAI